MILTDHFLKDSLDIFESFDPLSADATGDVEEAIFDWRNTGIAAAKAK